MLNHEPEKNLLIAAARSPLSYFDYDEFHNVSGHEIDWQFVLQNSGKHGIAPLMYSMLSNLKITDGIPEDVIESLRGSYLVSLMRGKKLYQNLAAVQVEFEKESIPVILLKGGALGLNTYADFGLRPISDLDILVKRKDLHRCRQIMEDLGFELVHGVYGVIPDERNEELGCEWMYVRDSSIIELHWNLTTQLSPFSIDPRVFWQNASPVEFEGIQALAMGTEDQIIHVCTHQFKHHWEHLRDLTDVALLLDKHGEDIDWSFIAARSCQQKSERCVYHTLSLANRVLGAHVPEEAFSTLGGKYRPSTLAQALEDMIASNIFEENMPRRFWELILVSEFRFRIKLVRDIVARPFPRKDETEAEFGRQKAHDVKGKMRAAFRSLLYYRHIVTAYPVYLLGVLRRKIG